MASTSTVSSETVIDAKVQKRLEGTIFAPSVLKKLSGGSVNWIYHATLSKPLDDGAVAEVLVKHGEKFMASKPDFPLNLHRCRIEVECFRNLSDCPFTGRTDSTDSHSFTARTPKFFHFYEEDDGTNQILEYLPNGINLKNYLLQNYPAPNPESLKPQCRQLGKALGRWLKAFVEWNARQPELRRSIAENTVAQQIRHMVNFLWLYDRIKEYPTILDEAKDIFGEVEKTVAAEQEDESKLQMIHGDFWTGNVVIPNEPFREGCDVPLFVIDWEIAHLSVSSVDFGQMLAELYSLWLYKSMAAGLWMMEGLVDAYGDISEDFAFRAAIQMGSHLVCITPTIPGWGTPEQIEGVVRVGRDIIVHSWKKERSWFEKGNLAPLFSRVT